MSMVNSTTLLSQLLSPDNEGQMPLVRQPNPNLQAINNRARASRNSRSAQFMLEMENTMPRFCGSYVDSTDPDARHTNASGAPSAYQSFNDLPPMRGMIQLEKKRNSGMRMAGEKFRHERAQSALSGSDSLLSNLYRGDNDRSIYDEFPDGALMNQDPHVLNNPVQFSYGFLDNQRSLIKR